MTNGHGTTFWFDLGCKTPFDNKLNNTRCLIKETTKVSDFLIPIKHWDTDVLTNILPNHIINKIKPIPIPIIDINDKIGWKFTPNGEYLVKW